MALLAVAYPQLPAADYDWIQAIRQQHDSHYNLIKPHVTLIFPINTISPEILIAHITAQAAKTPLISLTFRCAMLVKDAFSPLTHLFLVPDEGFSALVKLHDALYTDVLADALRLDVPFIPHITIGDFTNPQHGKAVADAINRQDRAIRGQIDTVDVISHANNSVTTVTQVELE